MSSVSFPSGLKLTSLKSPVLFVTVNGGTLSNARMAKSCFLFFGKFNFQTWQRDRYWGRMWGQRQVEQGGQQGRSRGNWNMISMNLTSTSKKSSSGPCCWTHKRWCGWGRRQERNVPKYGILTLYQLAVYGTAPAASQHEVKCFSMSSCTFDDWMHWALSG